MNSTKQEEIQIPEIQDYCNHLVEICEAFNQEAGLFDIPARLDPSKAVVAVQSGTEAVRAEEFYLRTDDSGVIHENQIRTVVAAAVEMLADTQRHGLILGAMQSGKTGAAMALQFLGPILYMLRGIKPAIFYLLGNLTSHEAQTKHELSRFLEYYGDIEVIVQGDAMTLSSYQQREDVSVAFRLAPSIKTYRRSVTRGIVNDFEPLELVHRRVKGQAIERIARICRRVTDAGCLPVIVADEPQFGASDGVSRDGLRSDCVMRQVLDEIDEHLEGSAHVFVGLSATPYELTDLAQLWKVHLRLSSAYSGFNFFNGSLIDPTVTPTLPMLLSMRELGASVGVPFLEYADIGVSYGSAERFEHWAELRDYEGDQEEYQQECIEALRTAILSILQSFNGEPLGICIRALNNNSHSDDLIARLNLPSNQVEVVRYFGSDSRGQSLKQILAGRSRPDLPVLILVTNRARMADAFPQSVTHFIEFAKRASDRNALLQGLFGRACGFGKQSTVIMSAENIAELRLFEQSRGLSSTMKPSRHAVEVQSRRPAATVMIKLNIEDSAVQQDPVLRTFIRRVQAEVLDPLYIGVSRTVRDSFPRQSAKRLIPLARIAAEVGLFDYLRTRGGSLFPFVEGRIEPVLPGEEVPDSDGSDGSARFEVDAEGRCCIGLRWDDTDRVRGGVKGRGQGKRDGSQIGSRNYSVLEPQITLEKYDPATDETIPRTEAGKRREGAWRVKQVALPNRVPIRQRVNNAGNMARVFPVPYSPYDDRHMTDGERVVREGS